MIDFPANPTTGQQFTAAGVTWTFDGTKWTAGGLGVAYLPLAGGTMLGPLYAPQGISAPQVIGDNRLINGDMRIDQRNNGASGTANGVYTADRWRYGANQAGKVTWQRLAAGASLVPLGFGYSFGFTSSSAYASLASDYFQFFQPIEADMVSDFAWGTPNAQPVTLSFLATANQAGTYSGSIQNFAGTRSYPFSFPLTTNWTKIAVTIPGDTAGAWVLSGNAASVVVVFDLGNGATYRGPANVWAGANYSGVTGSVSLVATNGASFQITGVKLEIGSIATPFNRQSLAQALAACQRYYYQSLPAETICSGQCFSATQAGGYRLWPVIMRAQPTILTTPGMVQCYLAGGGNSAPFTGGSFGSNASGSFVNLTGTSGLVAGNATILLLTSGNSLMASAEL